MWVVCGVSPHYCFPHPPAACFLLASPRLRLRTYTCRRIPVPAPLRLPALVGLRTSSANAILKSANATGRAGAAEALDKLWFDECDLILRGTALLGDVGHHLCGHVFAIRKGTKVCNRHRKNAGSPRFGSVPNGSYDLEPNRAGSGSSSGSAGSGSLGAPRGPGPRGLWGPGPVGP